MPLHSGSIKKLISEYHDPIQYFFAIGDQKIPLNDLIGYKLSLTFLNEIFCIQCARKTKKSFQQGYCYPCYLKLLDCNLCMIHPEKCSYPEKDCPDTWAHAHCKQDHIVYLANSSHLKVGITRHSQMPTRWIDQGAVQALPLFKVKNRNQAGQLEVLFKRYIDDKTNWRKMLMGNYEIIDLTAAKDDLFKAAEAELQQMLSKYIDIESLAAPPLHFNYPLTTYPAKLKTISLDKTPALNGKLMGIKGQYLMFDLGVINIRKHNGFFVELHY